MHLYLTLGSQVDLYDFKANVVYRVISRTGRDIMHREIKRGGVEGERERGKRGREREMIEKMEFKELLRNAAEIDLYPQDTHTHTCGHPMKLSAKYKTSINKRCDSFFNHLKINIVSEDMWKTTLKEQTEMKFLSCAD